MDAGGSVARQRGFVIFLDETPGPATALIPPTPLQCTLHTRACDSLKVRHPLLGYAPFTGPFTMPYASVHSTSESSNDNRLSMYDLCFSYAFTLIARSLFIFYAKAHDTSKPETDKKRRSVDPSAFIYSSYLFLCVCLP